MKIKTIVSKILRSSNRKIVFTFQLQNALRSFVELSEKFPDHLQEAAKLSHPLEPTDVTGKALTVKEFAKVKISNRGSIRCKRLVSTLVLFSVLFEHEYIHFIK